MDVALLKGKLEMCLKICQMYMAFYPAISLQGIHTKELRWDRYKDLARRMLSTIAKKL